MPFVINGDPSTWQTLRPGRGLGKGGPQRTVRWKCFWMRKLFNYTCKFEESHRVEAQENAPVYHFFPPSLSNVFRGSSSVTTNALRGHDTNIQLVQEVTCRILSETLPQMREMSTGSEQKRCVCTHTVCSSDAGD